MRRQEATEDGERENLPSWMFFFLIWLILGNKWRETDDRQAVRNELCFSLLSCCTFSLLAPCTFDKLILLCMNEHNVRVCRAFSQGRAGECGAGVWFESPRCVSRGCFIRDHQQSGLIPPLILCLRFASFPFLTSTSCCLVVCTACCVMKGQSSGKRGSWHGNKVLHISTYLPALKASEVKLVSHSCEDEICERENVDSPSVAE